MAQPFEAILRVVSVYREVSIADIKGSRRDQAITMPRFEAIYLAHRLTGYSLGVIGRHLGDRDNSTIRQALKRIEERIEGYPQMRREIDEMEMLAKQLIARGPSITIPSPAAIDPFEVAARVNDARHPCLVITADEVRALAGFVAQHGDTPNHSAKGKTA